MKIQKKKFIHILLTILSIICLWTIYSGISSANFSVSIPKKTRIQIHKTPVYKFENPLLAYRVLIDLGMNKGGDIKYKNKPKHYMNPIIDPNYCDKSLQKFTDNTGILFHSYNFWTDYGKKTILRRIIRKLGHSLPDTVQYYSKKSRKSTFKISLRTMLYFISDYYHVYMVHGKEVACNHQMYSKLLNISSLGNKGNVAYAYENYIVQYNDRPQCIERNLPETYMLANKTQCEIFFNFIESAEYQKERKKGVMFIQKFPRAHMGTGVYLMDDKREANFKDLYNDYGLCDLNQQIQMQRYIHNPLLLYGHKFDFRVYMLIVSVKPLIAYFHDGFLRVSLQNFTLSSNDKTTHFTNTHLAEDLFEFARKNGTWNDMTESDLRDFQTWNFTRLHKYLLYVGKTHDNNWLDNYLRNQLMTYIAHVLRSTQDAFIRKTNTYQLWGMDFIMDDNLKLWFIEANARPGIMAASPMRKKFMEYMVEDMFKLVYAHLRSRMKKVILYVNDLVKRIPSTNFHTDYIKIPNLELEKVIFETEINVNYMDADFEPKNTSFYKIVDESLSGEDRYMGRIKEECI